MAFESQYSITPETAKSLMVIEASRAAVDRLPISPQLIASLRESARLLSTHYSTENGPSHNYHLGRAEADVSGFVQYFCKGMADAFSNVRARAETVGGDTHQDKGALMRELRPLQRQALGLFVQSQVVTAGELADYLGIAPRQGRDLCAKWSAEGFLAVENPSKKARSYRLSARYEEGLI